MEETEDCCYYFSDGAESLDSYDREQMEIALYSKIHFATNFDLTQNTDTAQEYVNDDFDITVEGNENTGYKASETNADYVLNRDIKKKYDSVMIDSLAAPSKRTLKAEGTHKTRQVIDEVKKSKHIQSFIRKNNLTNKRNAANLGDSGIQLDDSKEDIISIDDSNDGTIHIDETTTDSDSDNRDILLEESSSDCLDDVDIKMNVHTPRYTYTKMTGQSHLDNDCESDGSIYL